MVHIECGQVMGNDWKGANHGRRRCCGLTVPMRQEENSRANAGPLQAVAGCAAQRRAGAVGAPRLSLLNLGVTDRTD